jgi:aldehyde dehydrogenase (NAD+)
MTPEPFSMTIDGRDVAGAGQIDVINPATGQVFAQAPDAAREQLDAAVAAARRAQPGWAAVPFEERRRRVVALADIVQANLDPLMRLLTQEQGKPHEDATGELMGSAYWFMTAAQLELPVEVLEDSEERRSVTHRVPIGVVGAILPWNFPVLVFAFKVIPALLAGNTIVAKPSPYTPLTTLRVGQLLQAALPPGVLNVVSGGDELGRWMTEHPGIDKIGFTGSTATGKKIMRGAADTMKRVTLELGGNDAAIVLPDVDVKAVSEALFWGAFRNTGQICVAAKRLYVHEDIYEEFFRAFVDYAATVKMGDGAKQGTQLGPIQNRMQFERVRELIADSIAHGYKVHSIGEQPPGDGYFTPLTVVEDPPEASRIVAEEQFGPVIPILKFKSVDEVVSRANASPYGLAGSVWSKDTDLAEDIAARLQCGNVWINAIQDSPLIAPIAGHKQSGLGVENGNPGLLEYTNVQTVTIRKRPAAAVS